MDMLDTQHSNPGASYNIPLNSKGGMSTLFDGLKFFIHERDNERISRRDLEWMISECGGQVETEKKAGCLLIEIGTQDEIPHNNQTLSHTWILDSISKFAK